LVIVGTRSRRRRQSAKRRMSDEDDASAKFQAKYGDVRPKPRLIASDVKHFDSADWAMRQSLDRARESAGAGGRGAGGTSGGSEKTESEVCGNGGTEDSAMDAGGKVVR